MKEIRKATLRDAIDLAPRLRSEDRRECIAATGLPPQVTLPMSVRHEDTLVFTDKGRPEVIFGVAPVNHYLLLGLIWMVASERLATYRRELVTIVPPQLDVFHKKYPILGNHVDSRNTEHVKWIKRSGFSFLRVLPEYGIGRVPFLEFARISNT